LQYLKSTGGKKDIAKQYNEKAGKKYSKKRERENLNHHEILHKALLFYKGMVTLT